MKHCRGNREIPPWDIRQLVILNREKGISLRKIAEVLNLAKSTVFDILKCYKTLKWTEARRVKGEKSSLTPFDERYIVGEIVKNLKTPAMEEAAELTKRKGYSTNWSTNNTSTLEKKRIQFANIMSETKH